MASLLQPIPFPDELVIHLINTEFHSIRSFCDSSQIISIQNVTETKSRGATNVSSLEGERTAWLADLSEV